jgi:hypothetical protein
MTQAKTSRPGRRGGAQKLRHATRFLVVPSRVFKAKHPGTCWLCGKQFPAGKHVRYIAKNTVAHAACVSDLVRPINDLVLGDEKARENMRSHTPSTWRRGKSPSDYG